MIKRVQLINNLYGIDLQNIMECLTEHRGRDHQFALFRLFFLEEVGASNNTEKPELYGSVSFSNY